MNDILDTKLKVFELIKAGIDTGLKNIVPILVNTLLWLVTIWIPYINIGTTIGMIAGITVKAGRGEPISLTEIFNPQYRKYMGEFFLTSGLIGIGVATGCALFIIPGCVIAIAWSLALPLVVDGGKNPTEAISLSNKLTYGNKGTIFLANLAMGLIIIIAGIILSLIPAVGLFLTFLVLAVSVFVFIGMAAHVYTSLCDAALPAGE
jgi:uncharacterized membrane protein